MRDCDSEELRGWPKLAMTKNKVELGDGHPIQFFEANNSTSSHQPRSSSCPLIVWTTSRSPTPRTQAASPVPRPCQPPDQLAACAKLSVTSQSALQLPNTFSDSLATQPLLWPPFAISQTCLVATRESFLRQITPNLRRVNRCTRSKSLPLLRMRNITSEQSNTWTK